MKICVQGLWHLGSVTAACMASIGHEVVGLDAEEEVIEGLTGGHAPMFEPGLNELVSQGINSGKLSFSSDRIASLAGIDFLWITYDTPVNDEDKAEVDFVISEIKKSFEYCPPNVVVIISSQLPVGSIRQLENFVYETFPHLELKFACSPENLRLGKALDVFLNPDRIIVGYRTDDVRKRLNDLLAPLSAPVEWMTVESAEMTKHAINGFLALSVVFANEIACICEKVGADAKEVERGLKTEERIGQKAYVAPGAAYSGGTLARDINFLHQTSLDLGLSNSLLASVKPSNDNHKNWVRRHLLDKCHSLSNSIVAVWGLTYKPGTNTLRRSSSVELCHWLVANGASVRVHDPTVDVLPVGLLDLVDKFEDPLEMLVDAHALIISTEWPLYKKIEIGDTSNIAPGLLVLDANHFVPKFSEIAAVKYITVGSAAGIK